MSYALVDEVFDIRESITSGERLVLAALARHADATYTCWPGIDLIAAETSLSARTVLRKLAALARRGWIAITSRPRRSSLYRLVPAAWRRSPAPASPARRPVDNSPASGVAGDAMGRQPDSQGCQPDALTSKEPIRNPPPTPPSTRDPVDKRATASHDEEGGRPARRRPHLTWPLAKASTPPVSEDALQGAREAWPRLRTRLQRATNVRWDRWGRRHDAAAIRHLAAHGPDALYAAAIHGPPPRHAAAYLTRWSDLPADSSGAYASAGRQVVRCDEHGTEHPASSPCGGCRADELAVRPR